MTRLLASVRSVAEARIALEGGADIIDLKEPSAGALGAVPLTVTAAVVRLATRQLPVSATVGDQPMHPPTLARVVAETAATGVDFVKVGLFGAGPFDSCIEAVARAQRGGARLVAVLFADPAPPVHLSDALAAAGFSGVMLDTADKRAGSLHAHATDHVLHRFVAGAREARLLVGLAGSLTVADIPPLLTLRPDYLGFRGCLCTRSARESALDTGALADVRRRIPRAEPALT